LTPFGHHFVDKGYLYGQHKRRRHTT
jgi:hypothetical protein